jgi:hypothetical protein
LRKIVLKELVDNALDAGANVTIDYCDGIWVVTDDGPGLYPVDVPGLFSVNRPLLSSKLKRLPLRGMLGNGLRVVVGAVGATGGSLVVETRGRRLTLAVCRDTGQTLVVSAEPSPLSAGLRVRLGIGLGDPTDGSLARDSITLARHGEAYAGPSSPWWYGATDLHRLFSRVTPPETTVGLVCHGLGLNRADDRPARTLNRDQTETVLVQLRTDVLPVPPDKLGCIGKAAITGRPGYALQSGTMVTPGDAHIPFIIEAWASCSRPTQKGVGKVAIAVIINRTVTVATIYAASWPGALGLKGCGLDRQVAGPSTGDYQVTLSVIAPYIQLASDGKEPSLAPFSESIAKAMSKACSLAHRAMTRPEQGMSIKDAARTVMGKAYRVASGNGRYPANARQVMYAARPDILRLTGNDKLDDAYFTQVLLPDYVTEYGKDAEWDVVFDSRGNFVEPHTGHEVRLGTIDVRAYLGEPIPVRPVVAMPDDERYPTIGPQDRFSAVLFIEKEGFAPLLQVAQIAERFDIAIMSTKGMSTTAARQLLDSLAPKIAKVMVLHDFDVSGFSIFGTLGVDGRRYSFANNLPIVDIGLRLTDVIAIGLQSEPVDPQGSWEKRSRTLAEHGATRAEIDFLRTRRVELNALPADLFVDFLERKLAEQGIGKVVPDHGTLVAHARRVVERDLVKALLLENQARLQDEATSVPLPTNLDDRVAVVLERRPALSWDQAVAAVIHGETT